MKRFQFSLRTLLVAVALIGAAIAWLQSERGFIRQRKEFLAELATHNRTFSMAWETAKATKAYEISQEPSLPMIRRCLGDQAYLVVVLPEDADEQMIQRANDLFPEAILRRSTETDALVDIKRK